MTRPRIFSAITIVAAGVLAAEALWLRLELFGARGTTIVSDVSGFLIPAAAGAACFVAARRGDLGTRRAWRLLGAAALAWASGQALWTWDEAIRHVDTPFPGWADAGFVAMFPLAVAGILAFPHAAAPMTSRARVFVDGVIFGGALFFVGWSLLLGPAWHDASGSMFERVLAVTYPVAGVVLLTLAVFVGARSPRESRRPFVFVAGGMGALAAADAAFLALELRGGYATGHLLDVVWNLGFVLLGLGAVDAATRRAGTGTDGSAATAWPLALAPYVAVLVAAAAAAGEQIHEGALEPVLFWTAMTVFVLVVVRQVLSSTEILRLNQNLEQLVDHRTEQLSERERRFHALVEHSSEVISIVEPDTLRLRFVTESVERWFGYPADGVLGHEMWAGVHADDLPKLRAVLEAVAGERGEMSDVSYRLRHADGTWRDVLTTVKNLTDDESVAGLVLNTRDVTAQRQLEEQLTHQAFHDSLTQLPNRALFTDRVEQALARAARSATPVSVLYLDLDGFKHVNDTFGHATGDELLVAVAERLERLVRSADTVARFGGDEFAVLLADVPIPDHGERVARRICDMFEVPFTVDDKELRVGASVGIADAVTGLEDAGEMLRNADVAMYMAKNRGRGRWERFDPSMHVDASERLALEAELRHALDRGELFVEYQPVVDMASGAIEGVEALVRWKHPRRGVVSPGQFIPVAEESGLISPIGSWVMLEACRQVRRWQRDHEAHAGLSVNVNLSARQVRQPEIVDQVASVLAETGIDPGCLTLEITESVLMDDVEEIVERLTRLKGLGVNLAIDDFGTGYSSLSYLKKFPIDILKIDRSFVQGLGHGPEESALARAIIKLGRTFRLKTVAEGIEEPEQAATLREMGCDSGQGYFFHRPTDAARLAELLAGETRDATSAVPAS